MGGRRVLVCPALFLRIKEQLGLLWAQTGVFCTSLTFCLPFCAFLQFLFMLTYFLTENGKEKVVSYSFFRLRCSSVCYLIKVHLGSFIS